jgi:aminoglycoside phosphotransferase family enzyme/predicted kinase
MAVVGDQSEAADFLRALPNAGEPVRTVATHASLVFLTIDRAFKLKRAVRFPFLDFATPERRLHFCEVELALNRRTAPKMYLAVRRITREPNGGLAFDGSGELVDAIVEMRRFEDRDLFDELAQHGGLTPALMTDLAHHIVAFHKSAKINQSHGGVGGVARVLDINQQALRAASTFCPRRTEALITAFQTALHRHAPLLEARREAGKVRRCHGDLILRNICRFEGEPTLFDCLEFDEGLATIDVLYDLAFLLMDLWHRDQPDFANLVFNRYLDGADETDGLGLMPFFMAVRAAVRAHVTAVQASEAQEDRAETLHEALAYFELAERLMVPVAPILVAVGGLSGSGKSTAAASIASAVGAPPGARVLSSDRVRKALHGVAPETRLPETAYRPEISERVYARMRDEARAALVAGSAVVADAVFDRPADREAINRVAHEAAVPFEGFWLSAPLDMLLGRLAGRKGDPSDATAAVLLAQAARHCGELSWRPIDAATELAHIRKTMLPNLKGPGAR